MKIFLSSETSFLTIRSETLKSFLHKTEHQEINGNKKIKEIRIQWICLLNPIDDSQLVTVYEDIVFPIFKSLWKSCC